MKKTICLLFLIMMITGLQAYSQKYKTVEDTARLNREFVKVTNDIAELNAKLAIAQNNLPGYKSKAIEAGTDADNAANKSVDQAYKVTNGDVGDARKAKRKARKAYREAKDSRSASNNVSAQESKITKLTLQINRKEQRLKELEVMRLAIAAKFTL
ncbi:MAG: hypothetical protein IPL50_10165 [Chitinophagaceae bacterium]|nr:hypothetical protein [Chitinophagaceae bacterium]